MEIDLEHSLVLIAQFSERATPLGTIVDHVPDSNAAARVVADVAQASGVATVWISPQLTDRAPGFRSALAGLGIEAQVIGARGDARDGAVGLSVAHRAIAETGSVLMDERLLPDRAASIMTSRNVVLVAVADLIPSLDSTPALLREIAMRGDGGYASFVTGPSRTADIEMSLTVGVQGPAQITVVFVNNMS
jgi:L-lactate dehydrogenase complex protein LldG